ncbi:hypothetical protein TNCV_3339991, partial [Trichonephila clavipes]
LLHDTYVDDIVREAFDLETGCQLQLHLRSALQFCKVTLYEWLSNSPELQSSSLSSDGEHLLSVDTELPVKDIIHQLNVISRSFGVQSVNFKKPCTPNMK